MYRFVVVKKKYPPNETMPPNETKPMPSVFFPTTFLIVTSASKLFEILFWFKAVQVMLG